MQHMQLRVSNAMAQWILVLINLYISKSKFLPLLAENATTNSNAKRNQSQNTSLCQARWKKKEKAGAPTNNN
jgi:hypothetical protein